MAKAATQTEEADSSFEGGTFENADNALVVDLASIEAASSNPVAAGVYECTVTGNEPKLSKNSGQPMWSVEYTITSEGEFNGRKLFDNMSFSPGALPMTKGNLLKLAPELEANFASFDVAANAPAIIGKQVRVTTKIEMYENEPQTRVKRVVPAAAAGGGFMEG